MQNPFFQAAAVQPFMKLTQANMELLTRYAFSPEATTEVMRNMQAMLEQGPASFGRLATSQSFVGLVQGLMQNYTEFLAELGQSGYGAMLQGPLALMQQFQAASSNVVDFATRAGRSR